MVQQQEALDRPVHALRMRHGTHVPKTLELDRLDARKLRGQYPRHAHLGKIAVWQ